MARTSRRTQAVALLLLLAPLAAHAQLSSVPNINKATKTDSKATGKSTGKATSQSKGKQTTGSNTFQLTNPPGITSSSEPVVHLSGVPTIAGAAAPHLVIPYTANAPFMRKSSLPEGTFFIAVGATLAFLGACVLLWRLLVAWSINRSVKRTALLASMSTSEKPGRSTSSYWGGSTNAGYNRVSTGGGGGGGKTTYYKDIAADSSVSLDNLTSAGKPMKPHFRDSVTERHLSGTTTPPANLFFSPTAQAAQHRDSQQHRNSGYMPSGYYASPSSQAAGGHTNIPLGGSTLAPGTHGNRHSAALSAHSGTSPPGSPGPPPQSRGSMTPGYRQSRDGLRAVSRDGLGSNRNSYLGTYPNTSSLMVGHQSSNDLPLSRAPSAYLEDLFENHGNGPRERF